MKKLKVLVAGGGIGGLTAAIALLRKGFDVHVFEAANNFSEVGAGVTLAPNAMCGFSYIGVAEALEAIASFPKRQQVRHWQDARVLKTLERGDEMRQKYGHPYVYMHRADLHNVLIETTEQLGGVMHVSSRVVSADHDDNAAWIELANGEKHTGDLVVGADGVKSAVRQLYETSAPIFSGHVAWRGVVPTDDTLQVLAENPGNFIGPDRLVVWYPLRSGKQLNLVFFARQSGWSEDGWTIPATRAELEEIFEGWCPEVRHMITHLDESTLYKWAINMRSSLKNWNTGGRITLLGDAAHAMTPFLGQGASSAIEDAVVLARALEDSDTLNEALNRYQDARLERTAFIQAESNANAERMQDKDSDSFGKKEIRNEETLGLFAYDCGAVPV